MNLVAFGLSLLAGTLAALAAWAGLAFPSGRRIRMLGTSTLIFLLPMAFIFCLQQVGGVILPAIGVIAVEEALKFAAARVARSPTEALRLIVFFGLWELAFVKTTIILLSGAEGAHFTQNYPLLYFVLLLLPVAMHAATGIIYAYYARGGAAVALAAGCLLHWLFNWVSGFMVVAGPGGPRFSGMMATTEGLGTMAVLALLWGLRPGQGEGKLAPH